MIEENQSKGMSVAPMGTSNLRANIRDIMEKRRAAQERNTMEAEQNLINDTVELWTHSAATPEIDAEYDFWSNYNGVAYMIYDHMKEEGAKDFPSDPRGIMDTYYDKMYPEKRNVAINALSDPDFDLEKFWVEQWLIPSEEDEEANALVSWLGWVWDTYIWNAFNLATNWVRNFVDSWEWIVNQFRDIYNWDENFSNYNRSREFWALENLAFMAYGKNVNQLTDREIAKLQKMLKDEEVMKAYEASPSKWMATATLGTLDMLFTYFFPWAKGKISVMANTPVLNLPIDALASLIQLWWRAVNILPWASDFRDSLWAEEYKQLWDMSVASTLLTIASGNKTVKKWTNKKLQKLAENTKLWDVIRVYTYYRNKFVDMANDYLDTAEGKLNDFTYDAGAKLKWGIDSIKEIPWKIAEIPWKVKSIPWKVWEGVSKLPWNVLRWTIRNALKLAGWGMEQYGKAREDVQGSKIWKKVVDDVLDPAIDEYINKWWNLDKEIPAETDPIKLNNAQKKNTEATVRITKDKKTESSTAFNDTLDRLSPERRSEIWAEKTLEDGSTWKKWIEELWDAINEDIMKPTMELENLLLENMEERPMTMEDIERLTAWKSESWRTTTESRVFQEWLEELLELENIEYELEPEIWIDWEPTWEIKIKLKYEEPSKSQADTYDLVDQFNNWELNVKNRWDAMRRLDAKAELIKEDWRLPKKWTNKNDILWHYRTIKNTLKAFIEETYPEYEGWFNELDKAYWQWKSSLAQIKNVSEKATWERANKRDQTQLQKDLSNTKLSLSEIWNKILRNEPLSYDDIDSNINLLLKQHYESSKSAWRTWWENFRDIVSKINELKKTEQSIMEAKWESDAANLTRKYWDDLLDILEELWVKDAEKKVEVKSESLFNEWKEQATKGELQWLQEQTISNTNPISDIMQEQKNIMIDRDKNINTAIKRTKTALEKLKNKSWK